MGPIRGIWWGRAVSLIKGSVVLLARGWALAIFYGWEHCCLTCDARWVGAHAQAPPPSASAYALAFTWVYQPPDSWCSKGRHATSLVLESPDAGSLPHTREDLSDCREGKYVSCSQRPFCVLYEEDTKFLPCAVRCIPKDMHPELGCGHQIGPRK